MCLNHRVKITENLINRGLSPFKVIIRKLTGSFRNRVLNSENMLLKTIADSYYFMFSKLTSKWNAALFNF